MLGYLTLLAFLVDQVQELGCRLFQAARQRFHSRTALWQRLRSLFTAFDIPDWTTLWEALHSGHQRGALIPNTSSRQNSVFWRWSWFMSVGKKRDVNAKSSVG